MPNIYDIVTKEFILNNVSEEDIFHKYLNIYPDLKQSFTNPLRNDDDAGCRFWRSSNTGMLYFKDFAMKWNWDCFNVVQYIHNNCSFKKALLIIAQDFNLLDANIYKQTGNYKISKPQVKKIIIEYRVKRGDSFNDYDLQFWRKWGITEEVLNYYNVSQAKKVWMIKDGFKTIVSTYKKRFPVYVYHFGGYNYKFYYPTRNIMRFIHSNSNILQGWDQLPARYDYIVITKSMKDVMCLYTFGIPAIAPMSETIYNSIEEKMPELQQRFNNIFILMDWDRTGKMFSKYFRDKYPVHILSFKSRKPKDFTDHYEQYGLQYMIDLIEYVKTEYNEYLNL